MTEQTTARVLRREVVAPGSEFGRRERLSREGEMFTHMPEKRNEELVRQAFEATRQGDPQVMLSFWHEGFRYYAFDAEGTPKVCRSSGEFAEIVLAGQHLLEEHENELVDLLSVGEELVVAHVRTTALAKNQDSIVSEYVMVFRVGHGRILWGCDFIDGRLQAFLDAAWSEHPAHGADRGTLENP